MRFRCISKGVIIWFGLFMLVFVRVVTYYGISNFQKGTHLTISGLVLKEPIQKTYSQIIYIDRYKINLPKYPQVNYGDWITVEGKYKDQTLKQAKLLQSTTNNNIIFETRERILGFFQRSLPLTDSSLVAGLTLGSSDRLPDSFWHQLTNTGMAHVVVASGANVSLVASFFLIITTFFVSRRKAILLTFIFVVIFVLLAGLEAPIIRAGVLACCIFIGQLVGRKAHTIRLLIFVGLIMLLVRPYWIGDLGFTLSFAATVSLVIFGPKLLRVFRRVPEIVRADLATTLAAQIGVLPLLIINFGHYNPISPLVNTLLLWTVPKITMIGLLAGLISFVSESISKYILILVYPLTRLFVITIGLFN